VNTTPFDPTSAARQRHVGEAQRLRAAVISRNEGTLSFDERDHDGIAAMFVIGRIHSRSLVDDKCFSTDNELSFFARLFRSHRCR
jgi:hypothetical protein